MTESATKAVKKPKSKKPSKAKAKSKARKTKAGAKKEVKSLVPTVITDYDKIRADVEKPTARRSQIETKRGNMRTPRRYHLTSAKMEKLMDGVKKSGDFPNPYRKGGIYHAIVQALANLGVNKEHTFMDVRKEVENVLGGFETKKKENAWEAFANRKSRNELSGKDVDGRILQNAMVLQRLSGYHLYGEKLRQLLSCIDVLKAKDGLPILRLNTNFKKPDDVKPINELCSLSNRGRRKKKVTVTPAEEQKKSE